MKLLNLICGCLMPLLIVDVRLRTVKYLFVIPYVHVPDVWEEKLVKNMFVGDLISHKFSSHCIPPYFWLHSSYRERRYEV